jgi:hypothetical protein
MKVNPKPYPQKPVHQPQCAELTIAGGRRTRPLHRSNGGGMTLEVVCTLKPSYGREAVVLRNVGDFFPGGQDYLRSAHPVVHE